MRRDLHRTGAGQLHAVQTRQRRTLLRAGLSDQQIQRQRRVFVVSRQLRQRLHRTGEQHRPARLPLLREGRHQRRRRSGPSLFLFLFLKFKILLISNIIRIDA